MAAIFRLRISAIWLLLVVATCVSWEAVQGLGWASDYRIATAAVMIVAFVKARFIMLDFMELRDAPLALRLFAEGWAILVCAAIILMYWIGPGVAA